MTKTEKINFKKWNIEQGMAKERAAKNFNQLKEMAREIGLKAYSNAAVNLENILKSENASEKTKQAAVIAFEYYIKNTQRFDCLMELLQIFN